MLEGGHIALFHSDEEFALLPSLLREKNLEVHQTLWGGAGVVENGISSPEDKEGKEIVFLVQTLQKVAGGAVGTGSAGGGGGGLQRNLLVQIVPRESLFPFVCRIGENSKMQMTNLLPIGFGNIVEVENYKRSFRIVKLPPVTGKRKVSLNH